MNVLGKDKHASHQLHKVSSWK